MSNLKISVITVCYNAADCIEETILSVLDQKYPDIEYIIIDGGSDDGTVDVIRKYADRIAYWISEPDKGIYDAMNKGIRIATGNFINFMNAGDCFYSSTAISESENILKTNPAVAFGSAFCLDPDGDGIEVKPRPFYVQPERFKYTGICHQSTFVRSDLMKKHGFDTKYSIAADYNLLKILHTQGEKFVEIPRCIAIYDTTGISSTNLRCLTQELADISGMHPYSIRVRSKILRYQIKTFISKLIGR